MIEMNNPITNPIDAYSSASLISLAPTLLDTKDVIPIETPTVINIDTQVFNISLLIPIALTAWLPP